MWIKFPEQTKRVDPSALDNAPEVFDEPLELNDNGSANVSEAIAEYLLSDSYDGDVSEYEN